MLLVRPSLNVLQNGLAALPVLIDVEMEYTMVILISMMPEEQEKQHPIQLV